MASIARSLTAAVAGLLVCAPAALAAPVTVEVRVEAGAETLFEGPIVTEGHDVQASSDTAQRPCDGVNPNDPGNLVAGPTPTAAAVDAMSLLGEGFDGVWNHELDDYFVTRWGPVSEAGADTWSVSVNGTLLHVGGCQLELQAGAQVMWSYGTGGKLLFLYPQGAPAGAPPLTAGVQLGSPFTVTVAAGENPAAGYQGASVSPVRTAADGYELTETASPETVVSGAGGTATVRFTTPGWHRIKAAAAGAVRSNRLDVCVSSGSEGCGPPPTEDATRTPSRYQPGSQGAGHPGEPSGGSGAGGGSGSSEAGPGGTEVIPPGSPLSTVPVTRIDGVAVRTLDDRSPAIRYRGRWRRRRERGALDGTVTIGRAGSSLSVSLPAGIPAILVRSAGASARVQLRWGTYRETLTVPQGRPGRTRLLSGPRRGAGEVTMRVLAGEVAVDGVALRS